MSERDWIPEDVILAAPLPPLEPGETTRINASDVDRINSHCVAMRSEIAALAAENARLRKALEEAIEWDGWDEEGVPAVWLHGAHAALKWRHLRVSTGDGA